MADELKIKAGWLTEGVNSKIGAANGFYYFEDGPLKCVLMAAETVAANTVIRTRTEFFSQTVEKSDADLQLILAANYASYSFLTADDVMGPWQPDKTTIEGMVVSNTVTVAGTAGHHEPNKAFFSFDRHTAYKWERIQFGRGDPPLVTAGFSGLVPLVLGDMVYDETNKWFKHLSQDKGGREQGRCALARSRSGKHLLAVLQPHGGTGYTVPELRDRFIAGDMVDAVLLDGSTSVMMYLKRSWVQRQTAHFKNQGTVVGVGFYYPPKAQRYPSPDIKPLPVPGSSREVSTTT